MQETATFQHSLPERQQLSHTQHLASVAFPSVIKLVAGITFHQDQLQGIIGTVTSTKLYYLLRESDVCEKPA